VGLTTPSLFAEFEPAAPVKAKPAAGPKAHAADPLPLPRARLSPWSLPELQLAVLELEEDRAKPWDQLIPRALMSAAYFLTPTQLSDLCDWFLTRLRDLHDRVTEDRPPGVAPVLDG
jgi:hypothetical protein